MALSPNQRRFLCAKAHTLKPVVQVGQSGITDSLRGAIAQALTDHELIKVKFGQSYPGTPRDDASELGQGLGAELCQVVGRVATYFRARGKVVKGKENIELPAAKTAT